MATPSFRSKLLEGAYYAVRSLRKAGDLLGISSSNQLRVLIYHDIDPRDENRFANQLRWLSGRWNFVTPQEFSAMMSGEKKIKGRNLLLTFDDGFVSNRVVAEKILNPMGIKAVFFIVSDFAGITDHTEALKFSAENISAGTTIPVPEHWDNMKWDELALLVEQGHTIGAHTKSHARLSSIKDHDQLVLEICNSADIISAKLGIPVEHFAYTFGDINSISKTALDIAKQRFRFVYSGIRGNNLYANTHGLYRDAAAHQDENLNYFVYSNKLLGTFLEGAADPYYSSRRKQLIKWTSTN